MPRDRWRLWLAATATVMFSVGTAVVYADGPSTGSADPAPVALDGRTVFRARGCIACHQGPGIDGGGTGPNLTAVASVAGTRVPDLDAAEYLRQSIREPQAIVVPGFSARMPDLRLSEDEIEAVVTFLMR